MFPESMDSLANPGNLSENVPYTISEALDNLSNSNETSQMWSFDDRIRGKFAVKRTAGEPHTAKVVLLMESSLSFVGFFLGRRLDNILKHIYKFPMDTQQFTALRCNTTSSVFKKQIKKAFLVFKATNYTNLIFNLKSRYDNIPDVPELTWEENEALRDFAHGVSEAEGAVRLGMTLSGIKTIRTRIQNKLGVNSLRQAMLLALELHEQLKEPWEIYNKCIKMEWGQIFTD
ncbi:MAG: hypothetical protein LBE31_08525 [Deltaproteobacteria bacterium]|nr:hypothetical protein [Deltaproteobacteria bacterium]